MVGFNIHKVNWHACCKMKTCSDEVLIDRFVLFVGLLKTEGMVEEGK